MLGGAEREVVAALVRALGPHGGEAARQAHRVSPVQPGHLARLARRDRHPRAAALDTRRRELHGDSGAHRELSVDELLLALADVHVRLARRRLGLRLPRPGRRPLHHHPFAVATLLVEAQVVRRGQRVEQADAAQVGVHRKEPLSQVLRALEVLQQAQHEHAAVRLLLLASRWRDGLRALEHDDLVHVEDGAGPSHLPHQVAAQLVRLRVVHN